MQVSRSAKLGTLVMANQWRKNKTKTFFILKAAKLATEQEEVLSSYCTNVSATPVQSFSSIPSSFTPGAVQEPEHRPAQTPAANMHSYHEYHG